MVEALKERVRRKTKQNELVLNPIVEPTVIDANCGKAYRKKVPSIL